MTEQKERYLRKLHQDILTIMDEVDRLCREHHLRYYLVGGSNLGAVRHKGFIPWDDDLDIAMPRKDFDRFIELTDSKNTGANKVLSDKFYLRWITTEDYYNQDFAKICLKGTLFQENYGKAAQNAGIYVDVFPFDFCEPYSKKIEQKVRYIKFFHQCLYIRGAEKEEMDWKPKHWPRNFIALTLSNRTIYKLMLKVICPLDEDKADFQAYFTSPYPIKRQIFPKSWHGEGKRLAFEGREYICPTESEALMQFVFGDNYMELPPVEKRKTHYPIHVVFSDGEEMFFEKPKNKMKYKDLLD